MAEAGVGRGSALQPTIRALEQRINELECKHIMNHLQSTGNRSTAKTKLPSNTPSMHSPASREVLDVSPKNVRQERSSQAACKSGYDIVNQAAVINRVMWPHGFLTKIQHLTQTKPEEISIEAFIFGYIEILLRCEDTAEKYGRLKHLRQIMEHCIKYNWSAARQFHYQVLREIEVGNLNWLDERGIFMTSLCNTTPASNDEDKMEGSTTSDEPTATLGAQEKRSIICNLYNFDFTGCRYENDGGCKKLHACAFCAEKGFLNKHRALECRK